MEKYDVNQPITLKRGVYQLNDEANFNYQLNRVIMWDGGDADEVSTVSHSIRTSSDWVNAMEKLAEKAHAEGRTENEIAYLRMSEFFIYDTDPKKKQRYEEARELFYEFYSDYFDKGIVKRYEVPYEGGYLPVMVTKANGRSKGNILLHGGNDSYFEELFFPMLYLAENGFDVYLYEGPGQGGVLRLHNMKFTHKWERPTKAVLNFFKLKDVTIVGASLGGYLAPRAAAFDKRIKRVVGWSIFPDFFDVVICDHPKPVRDTIDFMFRMGMDSAMNKLYTKMMEKEEIVKWNLLHGMYAYDAKTPSDYVRKIRKFTLKGIADRIDQDVLIIGANKDHFIMPYLFHEEYDMLQNARSLTLRLLTDKQDAGAHCNVGNSKLVLDSIIKWIECCNE
jgi:pimeloyl-ACP methyl ester carboxylesterase